MINPDSLIATNPNYYNAYVAAGDYMFNQKQFGKARGYYQLALTKVIATKPEEDYIRKKLLPVIKI